MKSDICTFDSELEFALALSKAFEVSKTYIQYPIPPTYKIQATLLNFNTGNDFYKYIQAKVSKFDRFLLKSIINSENNKETCQVFRINQHAHIYALFCSLRPVFRDINSYRLRDIVQQWCIYNKLNTDEYVVLREPFYESIKFFYNLLRILGAGGHMEILKHI